MIPRILICSPYGAPDFITMNFNFMVVQHLYRLVKDAGGMPLASHYILHPWPEFSESRQAALDFETDLMKLSNGILFHPVLTEGCFRINDQNRDLDSPKPTFRLDGDPKHWPKDVQEFVNLLRTD